MHVCTRIYIIYAYIHIYHLYTSCIMYSGSHNSINEKKIHLKDTIEKFTINENNLKKKETELTDEIFQIRINIDVLKDEKNDLKICIGNLKNDVMKVENLLEKKDINICVLNEGMVKNEQKNIELLLSHQKQINDIDVLNNRVVNDLNNRIKENNEYSVVKEESLTREYNLSLKHSEELAKRYYLYVIV
jgi:deoxyxylulose-5-phosphate synthase